jgi:hypothetical protein
MSSHIQSGADALKRAAMAGIATLIERLEERRLFAVDPGGLSAYKVAGPVDATLLAAAGVPVAGAPQLIGNGADDVQQLGNTVGVHITATDVNALLPSLTALGLTVVSSRPDLHFVEGSLPKASVPQLAALVGQGLLGAMPILDPLTNAGAVDDQAEFVHETDRVRNTLPAAFSGIGVRVGVLSDSYNILGGAAADVAGGDLPAGGVTVVQEGGAGNTDEGRAMLQLVHDLAPGSPLSFATANGGHGNFANNIAALAAGGSRVIVDDITYLDEPFFQDGVVAQAVNTVVAAGIPYFSSAGNSAANSYEVTAFQEGADPNYGSLYDFDPGAGVDTRQRITVANGATVRIGLQWDDPHYTAAGVDTDLDIAIVHPTTGGILASSFDTNVTSQVPSETFSFTNNTGQNQLDIVIDRFAGPAPGRMKYVIFRGGTVSEFATNSSTVIGHHAAAGGQAAVAAVPYFNQTAPEAFTSRGPTTILFSNAGVPQPAVVRQTPSIAAIDGTDTTFFGGDADGNGLPNFFGTSAAAPHAAAVAALVRQANPGFNAQQVYTRLQSTARDITPAGTDNVTGVGLVDAFRAVYGGPVAASLPLADGFESGALSTAWETNRTVAGRMLVSGANGPATGARHLTLDSSLGGSASLNEAILHVNAAGTGPGLGSVVLSFAQREFSDNNNAMPASFTGSSNSDGVALSVDGVNWTRVVSLTGAASTNAYQTKTFNLTQIATAAGLTLTADTRVKFQQFGNAPIGGGNGFAFDNVNLQVQNTAPVNTVPGSQTTNEDTALVFSTANGNAISVTDADAAANPISVTLTATSGTLTLGSTAGLNAAAGNGSSVVVLIGSQTAINVALQGLTFNPTANYNGSANLNILTNDQGFSGPGGPQTDQDDVAITVVAVNDAPVPNAPVVTVTEDGSVGIQLGATDVETAAADLVFTINSLPTRGLLTFNGVPVVVAQQIFGSPADLVYEASIAFEGAGTDTFQFSVTDTGDPAGAPALPLGAPLTVASAATINVTKAVPDGQIILDANGILRVGGSNAVETVSIFKSANQQPVLKVTTTNRPGLNSYTSPLTDVTEIRVWTRGGNDKVEPLLYNNIPIFVHAGDGNDTVRTSGIVFGGFGNDKLTIVGSAATMLVGGAGKDTLQGSDTREILVGGSLTGAATLSALRQAAQVWKILAVATPPLTNPGAVVDGAGAGQFDILQGAGNNDWLIAGSGDTTDRRNNDLLTNV